MTVEDGRGEVHPRSVHKLLDKMRRSRYGWGEVQLRKLYEGFGFAGRDVGNHVCYHHPSHPDLRGQVPRHRSLREYVVADAILAIEELLRREGEETDDEGS